MIFVLLEKIEDLKKSHRAVVLAHNYQNLEILDVADFVGDSIELARKAIKADAEMIVVCGVHFMAESAKILNPQKKVFLANKEAGCPMADMCTAEDILKKKKVYPRAKVVSYVNTSAEVKAESDICCTSANAIEAVKSILEEEIIFAPDLNLASYVSENTDKKVIPVEGYCYVHNYISLEKLQLLKEKFPKAETLVHPECPSEIRKEGDLVCSTSGMIKRSEESDLNEFIIVTESGLSDLLKIKFPNKSFHTPVGECADMKKTRLEDVLDTLEGKNNEIIIPEDVLKRARHSLDRMLLVKT